MTTEIQDPYKWFATELFNVRFQDVTSSQRQHAKSVAFAVQYSNNHPHNAAWKRALRFAGWNQ